MTERTVTVQTEQEETITLCDHCGLSDDAGELVTYKVSQADSNGVENVRDYDSLDIHKGCLDEFGVEVPEGPTFEGVFLENNPLQNGPVLAFPNVGTFMLLVSIGMIAVGLGVDGYLLSAFGVVVLIITLAAGYSSAKETLEDMKA